MRIMKSKSAAAAETEMMEQYQVCSSPYYSINALSPIVSTGSGASTLSLEDLDNLMLVEDDATVGAFTDTAGSQIMVQELEQLLLTQRNDSSSPLQCPSIDSWSSDMIIDVKNDEEQEASSSPPLDQYEQVGVQAQDQHELVTLNGNSDESGRTSLIDMLQQCIASHLDKKTKKRSSDEPPTSVVTRGVPRDVMTLLHDCAHAVAVRDAASASSLAACIRRQHGASPTARDARYRTAHYFVESLMARLLGTGTELTAASQNTSCEQGAEIMERVYDFRLRSTPSPLIPHFFSTQAILGAARGTASVHIVEIGLARNRFQWALLLQALAHRRGGPPKHLRVTAIDSPQHGPLLQQLADRIARQAAQLGMYAEIELGVADPAAWEGILPQIGRDRESALAVNALFALDFLGDETAVQARSSRRAVLTALHRLRPDVVVMGVNDSRRAVPDFSFLERFAQAVVRFNAKFEAAGECVGENEQGRMAYEGKFLGPEIVNLIACDGVERVVRTAPFEEWHRAMVATGFEVVPVEERTLVKGREMMKGYNRSFEMEETEGWIKLSWKKVTTQCVSAWRPRRLTRTD